MSPPLSRDRILCSGADSAFFFLLKELVQSIRETPAGCQLALGILDLGLQEAERQWLQDQGCLVVAPGWDVDFPGQSESPEWLKAMVSRPFLPRHFPGFASYGWLDADTWVQQFQAVEDYFTVAAAHADSIAIALEMDRAYFIHFVDDSHPDRVCHRLACSMFYGEELGPRLAALPVMNVGAFAAMANSPLWERWQQEVRENLQKSNLLFVEQVSLNYLVHSGALKARFMPSRHNWLVTLKVPRLDMDSGLLTEACFPYAPLGIIHLTGSSKSHSFRIHCSDGREIRQMVRYSSWRKALTPEPCRCGPGTSPGREAKARAGRGQDDPDYF